MSSGAGVDSLDVDLPNHFLYRDTMWLSGEVTDKYKEKVSHEDYYAIDLQLHGTNQLGEAVAVGSATVYLPSPGHLVTLPIPH